MLDSTLLASMTAGAVCFGAGVLALLKAPRSTATGLFIAAMWAVAAALFAARPYSLIDRGQADLANAVAKVFLIASLMAETLLWQLAIVFPIERPMTFRPLNMVGGLVIIGVALSFAVGSTATVDYSDPDAPTLSALSTETLIANSILMVVLATLLVERTRPGMDSAQWRSARIYLTGLWIFVASGLMFAIDFVSGALRESEYAPLMSGSLILGVLISGFLFAYSISMGIMSLVPVETERLLSSTKAHYKLLHRRVYLVHEKKPDFSMRVFSDILKGRCFDCQNDESFACESLDCNSCGLPCPCRPCKKYSTRTQGLIVTRQVPNDVRSKFYIQTTPILWLSAVAGKDNMDPAKLSLLTDFLVNFMERSQNGIVLVDGLEYLVTSSDFPRVLKAVDRWTEMTMASRSRLIISVDPKAFDHKELALLERNREVVRPDAKETWRIIPERI